MKTNKLIFRGKMASGKTWTANIIASLFPVEKVLWIDVWEKTQVGIAREIDGKDFDLIVFEDCKGKRQITQLQKHVVDRFFQGNENDIKNVIYLTLDTKFEIPEGFKVVECRYE